MAHIRTLTVTDNPAEIDLHNRVTGEELERLLKMQLSALEADPAMASALPPLMVWGAPGLGKSSILRDVARELGIGFIDVRLAQREPVDIRGLPVPGPDGVKWLVASEWPRDPASRGIILFDEITAADRSLQVAAYEFILDRRLGELYKELATPSMRRNGIRLDMAARTSARPSTTLRNTRKSRRRALSTSRTAAARHRTARPRIRSSGCLRPTARCRRRGEGSCG